MIDIEGISIEPYIKALASGEGFIVKLETKWFAGRRSADISSEQRQAKTEAKNQNIIGQRINGHSETYADAKSRVEADIDAFETEITDFISNWNSNN